MTITEGLLVIIILILILTIEFNRRDKNLRYIISEIIITAKNIKNDFNTLYDKFFIVIKDTIQKFKNKEINIKIIISIIILILISIILNKCNKNNVITYIYDFLILYISYIVNRKLFIWLKYNLQINGPIIYTYILKIFIINIISFQYILFTIVLLLINVNIMAHFFQNKHWNIICLFSIFILSSLFIIINIKFYNYLINEFNNQTIFNVTIISIACIFLIALIHIHSGIYIHIIYNIKDSIGNDVFEKFKVFFASGFRNYCCLVDNAKEVNNLRCIYLGVFQHILIFIIQVFLFSNITSQINKKILKVR